MKKVVDRYLVLHPHKTQGKKNCTKGRIDWHRVYGCGHLDVYQRLAKEQFPFKLTAICDIDPGKFANDFIAGNIDVDTGENTNGNYLDCRN